MYLYVTPDWPRRMFIVAIRTHIYAAWALIVALAIHVAARLGLLPTHGGILRGMFGDGTLPLATARRLWPEWTRRTLARAAREAPPTD
ncbi:hypothetical protein [Dokdonella sp.]|uniref:hypothetical protein n=1 Tax=Dokdonella sp. TaxID=2291710 RepID=UPI0027BA351E|nr:hypothetical protein [Dokdonella sp.]